MKFDRRFFRMVLQLMLLVLVFWWIITNLSGVLGFLGNVIGILSPFILGLCIAFVINIVMQALERQLCFRWRGWQKLKRPLCMVLSFLLVFGAIAAIILLIVPEFSKTISSLMVKAPQYSTKLQGWWNDLVQLAGRYALELPNMNFDVQKILNVLMSVVTGGGKFVLDTTIGLTTSLVGVVINFFVALIFSIYILAGKERYGAGVKRLLYAVFDVDTVNRILDVLSLANRIFTSFVTGQLTEAVIIAGLCFVGMLLFGFPYAAVVSVLVGFTALIPVFGAFIGTGIGAFLILLDTPIKAFWFVVFILVLQQLEGNLIYPKVVGKSVGLPAIFVLMAVTVGAGAMGIVGMLISVPLFSLLYTLVNRWVDQRLSLRPAGDPDTK